MPFESTTSTQCNLIDGDKVNIQIPKLVPSFLEFLPVTVTSHDPDSISVMKEAFENGSGVNCLAEVQYKVAADAHSIHYEVALDDVYSHFQSQMGIKTWFFEAKIKTDLLQYAKDGAIKVTEFVDGDLSKPVEVDPNDKKSSTLDMFNKVFDSIVNQLFVRATKIPDGVGSLDPAKGGIFNLTTSYTRSTEHFSFKGDYALQVTRNHASLIQIRVSPKNIGGLYE
jgi:hypothetical protein